eukprot:234524-Rhodomonas_salina.5
MNTFPRPCSVVSCVVCGRVKELDTRGYPRDAGSGSTVQARCGHHFCSECLLERVAHAAPNEYHCEKPGCGQQVAAFTIRRTLGDGTEPFATECAWGRQDCGIESGIFQSAFKRIRQESEAGDRCAWCRASAGCVGVPTIVSATSSGALLAC